MTLTASVCFRLCGDVHLSPGLGAHRMTLPVQVAGAWLPTQEATAKITPVLLIGTVWTSQPFRWLAGIEPQVLTLRDYPVGEELVVSLSDEQLIALGRARGAGDILLRIKLQVLTSFEGGYPLAQEDLPLRIPRSRWLEMLDQVGSEVGILVRVPSPLTDSALEAPPAASAETAASLSQAAARLRLARAELLDGQWEQCVRTCRLVLDNIGLLVATLPSEKSVTTMPSKQRTQDQRWAAIYYDVKSMASAAHHDDATTNDFVWFRADAEAILAATAGLLRKFIAQI